MRLTEEHKVTFRRVAGLCIMALAIFTLVSVASYLFTWKADMSLQSEESMLDISVEVSNLAGKLGYKTGKLLVCDWFGLGSVAFIIILAAVSARLIRGKSRFSLIKLVIISLTGAFIASIALSYVGQAVGDNILFGGGIGGRFGSQIIYWSNNLIGFLTPVAVLLIVFLWLLLSSRRFFNWVGRKSEEPVEEIKEEEIQSVDDVVVKIDQEKPEIPIDIEDFVVEPGEGFSTEIKQPLPRIDMRLEEVPKYKMPQLDILDPHTSENKEVSSEELKRNNNKIRASLANYKIQVLDVKVVIGPTVTLYKVYPAPGVRISEIKRLQEDIAMNLNARGVRVVTLDDCVGIEVANDNASIVPLRAMLNDKAFRESKAELPVAIGFTITRKVKVFDLSDTPHLLIAGATKQGKSVGLNVIVSSLLYSKHPSELKFVFIDPKMVEFSAYGRLIKHYLAVLPDSADAKDEYNNAIVKKAKDAEKILRSLCIEMDDRYELLSKAYVNNIKLYNEKYKDRHLLPTDGHKYLPYLVVVIDEYADLTMSVGGSAENKAAAKSIQNSIIRLAQKGRAAGIHVILATQRPSVDVISGVIKTNFPTRIAFRVASRIDSMTILDAPGAEKLIGKGDMLYYAGIDTERIQCAFVSNDEINSITEFVGDQNGYKRSYDHPYYLPEPAPAEGEAGGASIDMSDLDEKFAEAARMVVMTQKGSTSDLQRRLSMGYAKAGRVMDQLEAAGIVGPQEGSKPRQVLVSDFDALEEILHQYVK